MYQGKYVFAQVLEVVSRYEFNKCVARYKGNYKVTHFTCWQQFLCMCFGQLTYREGIRDIFNCLRAHDKKVYHLGIRHLVSPTTLTRANESRDWRIWRDFALHLVSVVRPLYTDNNDFQLDLENAVYALDSSTIDLCLNTFHWAKFRKSKGAVKLHTLLDLRGNIPIFIDITDGKTHDVVILDKLAFEAGAFYIVDKGYYDFSRLYTINSAKAFFVIRAKRNLRYRRLYSRKVDKGAGLKFDQTIKLTTHKSAKAYPDKLRLIKFHDREKGKTYLFLTNNFELDAITVALLYKNRWQIELFFKWIKQHLKIKKFWGHSENAVKTQIWTAVCTYLIIAILKKQLDSPLNLYNILQILSVSAFDKTPVNQLLRNTKLQYDDNSNHNQLKMFDL